MVSAESLEVDPTKLKNKYAKETKLGFIKMKVINSLKKEYLKTEVDKIIAKGTKLKAYGLNSYND